MHASAFLIRETKIGRRFARFFSRLGFLWELVIREERFWNFIVVSSLVDTRSAFPEIT